MKDYRDYENRLKYYKYNKAILYQGSHDFSWEIQIITDNVYPYNFWKDERIDFDDTIRYEEWLNWVI